MSDPLPATCEDTIGPYYPHLFAAPGQADLTTVHPGLVFRPEGETIEIHGRLLDKAGDPVTGALMEFWQANSQGRYQSPHHTSLGHADPHFRGLARIRIQDGRFVLRTVKPGAEHGRAPCVTVTVFADGITRLVTQLFFEDEPANVTDPVLRGLDEQARSKLIARRAPGEGPARYHLDLVMSGTGETPFFEDREETPRVLAIGPTDRTSELRTPRTRLVPVPEAAWRSFVPWLEPASLPGLRAGENDLTRLAPGRPRAKGDAIEITGSVRDSAGRPQPGVLLEMWNANTHGRYAHVDDHNDVPLDPLFLGHGRTITGPDGNYRFHTIMPGSYLARRDIGRWRPAHLHFSLRGGAGRLVTQMYFADDPHNATDPMRILMGSDFVRQIGKPVPVSSPECVRAFRFDIIVGGQAALFFSSPGEHR